MKQILRNEKKQAHELIDRLTPVQLDALVDLLESMLDPGDRANGSTPVEEEEIKPETAAAIERARASLARGEGIPHEEIRREFGLKK